MRHVHLSFESFPAYRKLPFVGCSCTAINARRPWNTSALWTVFPDCCFPPVTVLCLHSSARNPYVPAEPKYCEGRRSLLGLVVQWDYMLMEQMHTCKWVFIFFVCVFFMETVHKLLGILMREHPLISPKCGWKMCGWIIMTFTIRRSK